MKKLFTILFLCIACSCNQNAIDNLIKNYELTPLVYTKQSSQDVFIWDEIVYVKDKKYSGILYKLFINSSDSFFTTEYKKGMLDGCSKKWYPNKQLMEIRYYKEGKKNGKQISYWDNGNKKFEFLANEDRYEGTLMEWTYNGKLVHLANYVHGQEEGIQKLWYDNGQIRANYVMRNGKRYGLLGTQNCKYVSDNITK